MLRVPRWLQVVRTGKVYLHTAFSLQALKESMWEFHLSPMWSVICFQTERYWFWGGQPQVWDYVALGGANAQREGSLKWVSYGVEGVEGKGSTVLKSCPSGDDVEKDEASYFSLGRTCVRDAEPWSAASWLWLCSRFCSLPAQHCRGCRQCPWGSMRLLALRRLPFPLWGSLTSLKAAAALGKLH